jgi:hypothetical protein
MKNDSFIFSLCLLSAIFALITNSWLEPAWIDNARKAKIECEEVIPRNETCVIIALPKSKD